MQYSVPPMLLVSDIIYCSETTTLISKEKQRERERKEDVHEIQYDRRQHARDVVYCGK